MLLLGLVGAFALAGTGASKEIAFEQMDAQKHELYTSGQVMGNIMKKKEDVWARQRALGRYESSQYPEINHFVPCRRGVAEAIRGNANYTFKCDNMDLYSFKPHSMLGSKTGEGSSSWGWTNSDGREFVAIGQADGAAFVEITKKGQMVYLGRLPQTSQPIIWREIRGYKNYMVIGSEAEKHGIQIFDMRKLLRVDPRRPVTFSNDKDLTGFFNELPSGRTHNVVVNEETNFAFSAGAAPRNSSCKAGLIFIDLKNPSKPTTPGCASEDGYVHDAQCLIYRGPDRKYYGREICYGYNEDTLTIFDVTDKKRPKILSRTSYEGASYTHQGWVLDKNWQDYLIMDDEYDEVDKAGPAKDGHPVTYIWDIRSLERPKQTGYYKSSSHSIDHNQYVHDGKTYQSNYGAGLRVFDISSIRRDPTGKSVKEVGFFDIYPEDDNEPEGGLIDFVGSWSSYAMFESGFIFINTIERGAFVVKMSEQRSPFPWWPGRNDEDDDDRWGNRDDDDEHDGWWGRGDDDEEDDDDDDDRWGGGRWNSRSRYNRGSRSRSWW